MSQIEISGNTVAITGLALEDQDAAQCLSGLPPREREAAVRDIWGLGSHLYCREKIAGNLDHTMAGVQDKLVEAMRELEEISAVYRKLSEALGEIQGVASLIAELRHSLEEAWIALDFSRPLPSLSSGLETFPTAQDPGDQPGEP